MGGDTRAGPILRPGGDHFPVDLFRDFACRLVGVGGRCRPAMAQASTRAWGSCQTLSALSRPGIGAAVNRQLAARPGWGRRSAISSHVQRSMARLCSVSRQILRVPANCVYCPAPPRFDFSEPFTGTFRIPLPRPGV